MSEAIIRNLSKKTGKSLGEWIEIIVSTKLQEKSEIIELIKEKIKSDSIYFKYDSETQTAHSSSIPNQNIDENGNKCGCKIVFTLNYAKGKNILINLNSNPGLSKIVERMNVENIIHISDVFDENTAQALYGTIGRCGVIQMTTHDKEMERIINTQL